MPKGGTLRLYYVPCSVGCEGCRRQKRVLVDVDGLGRAGLRCPRLGFVLIPRRAPTEEEESGGDNSLRKRLCIIHKHRGSGATITREEVETALENEDPADEEDEFDEE